MRIRIRFELLTDELKSVGRKDWLIGLDDIKLNRIDVVEEQASQSAIDFVNWLKMMGYLR